MSLEQTIKDTIVSESYDLDGRLQQLVRAGLMPANTIPVLRKAISKVQGGMTLQGAERDVMANFINSMMFIVLGDDAIFNRARAGAKTYATEAKEKQEYDYEGDMAMGQLKSIIANSQRMHDMLSDDTNLPEWVQSKITLAEDYISTASNYMQGEMNEEQIDELSKDAMLKYLHANKHKNTKAGNPRRDLVKSMRGTDMAVRKYTAKPGSKSVRVPATEEVEQVDEISKATLGSYVKKASGAEQPKNVMSPKNVPLTKIAAYQGDSETGHFGKRFNQHTYDKAERLRKNRETGIKRAVDKLTKEEVEITEASVADVAKTAHLHVRAGKHDSIHTAIQSAVNTHFPSSVHSSVTRKKVAAQALSRIQSMNKSKMTKEDIELDEGNTTPEIKKAYADLIKTPSGSSERKTAIRRYKSLRQNLAKEEVEQVDEVSKRTLGRYINKAKDSIDMTSYRSGIKDGTAISSSTPYKSNNPLEKKLSKRHKGIETAVKKLTKEDIDAAKSMNESYKNKFDAALEHYNIKSPSELGEEQRKEFFNHVDLEFKKGDN